MLLLKLLTGQISELLELLTEKGCVEFPLNVLQQPTWLDINMRRAGIGPGLNNPKGEQQSSLSYPSTPETS